MKISAFIKVKRPINILLCERWNQKIFPKRILKIFVTSFLEFFKPTFPLKAHFNLTLHGLFTQMPVSRCSLLLFCCSVMSDSLQPHGLQHVRLPCPPLSSGVCSDSCPLSRWCYLTTSFCATPFSFCLRSFLASGSFPMSQLFASDVYEINIF